MTGAIWWGAVAASSLVLGTILALLRTWPQRLVGIVLAFGAGALVSSVSFELFEDGLDLAGGWPVGLGLGAGALTYYGLDRVLEPAHPAGHAHPGKSRAGTGLALGAFLDGIPEQMVLGIGLAGGAGVSISLLVAIFVSNLPESIGSASEMRAAGEPVRRIILLWVAVAVICTIATIGGYAIADTASDTLKAGIDGFAAGALLVMLVDSMIPEARNKAGRVAGLVTVLGFAVAAGLLRPQLTSPIPRGPCPRASACFSASTVESSVSSTTSLPLTSALTCVLAELDEITTADPRPEKLRPPDDSPRTRARRTPSMSDDTAALDDLEAIKQLKARYFRLMDTKDWDGLADVFTSDVVIDVTGEGGGVTRSVDEYMPFLQANIGEVTTVHHGHMPEITLESDTTARGSGAGGPTLVARGCADQAHARLRPLPRDL